MANRINGATCSPTDDPAVSESTAAAPSTAAVPPPKQEGAANTCEPHPACANGPTLENAAPTDLSCMVGDVGYYRARADDFVKRHPGEAPPSYYLQYGEKYAHLFTDGTSKKLSPQGQAWLKETFVKLQQAIEDLRTSDPAAFDRLEKDPQAFQDFAYGTHASAYLESGLSRLSAQEIADIAATPEGKDLVNFAALKQVVEVGGPVLADKLSALKQAAATELDETLRRAVMAHSRR